VGFVEAPQSAEELAAVGKRVRGPALANIFEGGKTPVLPASELARLGFKIGIYPSQTHRAAIFAVQEVLEALKTDEGPGHLGDRLASFADRETAVDSSRWQALERKYVALDE
jgi:2-methylisocitrate lyase-like PEP mutase family enzyme